ncbi:MAG: PD-(D/E)XK nuclease family protein [Deltaproteobacteria bacterium]|nr:PD-(D/E)XK nuclease family protein [Deltaproteobacteria bacterium]
MQSFKSGRNSRIRRSFLTSFIEEFIPKDKKEFFTLPNSRHYLIEEEKFTRYGRIDIYIDSLDSEKKFGIVIENKLYAQDQHKQIKRYYEFLKTNKFAAPNNQMMIFYLTIHGGNPDKHSIDPQLKQELTDKKILKNISYKKDIKNWLQKTTPSIQADKVKYSVIQYVNNIERL